MSSSFSMNFCTLPSMYSVIRVLGRHPLWAKGRGSQHPAPECQELSYLRSTPGKQRKAAYHHYSVLLEVPPMLVEDGVIRDRVSKLFVQGILTY